MTLVICLFEFYSGDLMHPSGSIGTGRPDAKEFILKYFQIKQNIFVDTVSRNG